MLKTQNHGEQAENAFQGDAQKGGAGRRLEGIDQGHAQHKRGQNRQPAQQEERRKTAEAGHEQQEQACPDEPGGAGQRTDRGTHDKNQRPPSLMPRPVPDRVDGMIMGRPQPTGAHDVFETVTSSAFGHQPAAQQQGQTEYDQRPDGPGQRGGADGPVNPRDLVIRGGCRQNNSIGQATLNFFARNPNRRATYRQRGRQTRPPPG